MPEQHHLTTTTHPTHPFCDRELCVDTGPERVHRQAPRLLCRHRDDSDEEADTDPLVTWWLEQANEPGRGGVEVEFPPVLVVSVGGEQARLPLLVGWDLAVGLVDALELGALADPGQG